MKYLIGFVLVLFCFIARSNIHSYTQSVVDDAITVDMAFDNGLGDGVDIEDISPEERAKLYDDMKKMQEHIDLLMYITGAGFLRKSAL